MYQCVCACVCVCVCNPNTPFCDAVIGVICMAMLRVNGILLLCGSHGAGSEELLAEAGRRASPPRAVSVTRPDAHLL